MRGFAPALILLAACGAAPPLHPAVTAEPEISDELRLSFFESFDPASFRALAERAFHDRDPQAEDLMFAVVWNWHPHMKDLAGRRREAQRLMPPLASHPDPRVRRGIWQLGRYLYQAPDTSAAWAAALPAALTDPDPDVRLAAIRTSIDLHSGSTGGCIVEPKVTAYSLRPHAPLLSARLLEEPDVRVRIAILRALAWCGRGLAQPALVRYLSEADRRSELALAGDWIRMLFSVPEAGLDQSSGRRSEDSDVIWPRLRDFAVSLQQSDAARRNGIVLLLQQATELELRLDEDKTVLSRVIDWLVRETDVVQEQDLHLVLTHWRVMDPDKVVHEPQGIIRRSNLPELLTLLRARLASLP